MTIRRVRAGYAIFAADMTPIAVIIDTGDWTVRAWADYSHIDGRRYRRPADAIIDIWESAK